MKRRWLKLAGGGAGIFLLTGAVLLLSFPFPEDIPGQPPAATLVLARDGSPLRVVLGRREELCFPISLNQTGDWLAQATIAAEDRRFFQHPGVDPIAVSRALFANLRAGRIVSGASTISSLVVKLATKRKGRKPADKICEFFRALQLEMRLEKEKILEAYLNRAPFGGNIVGAEAAARRYFGRKVSRLSLGEAALLAGLPQAPSRLRPDRHPKSARQRRDWILERMEELEMITPEQAAGAREASVSVKWHDLPFSAPHFCETLPKSLLLPGTLRTTLSPEIQARVEGEIRKTAARLRRHGAGGGAAVVIHVPTGEVLALVGSPDYFSSRWGQVNCATAQRSPGSALKPFIYCLAFDLGLITPGSRLEDNPFEQGGYRPLNYEKNYSGPVSARQALRRSLNIPAVKLTARIGPDRLAECLRRLGLRSLNRPGSYYGLTLAVGGGGVTLLELTNAAAVLGRGGRFLPPKFTFVPGPDPIRVFREASCWMTSDILSPPEHRPPGCLEKTTPWFAWKTGTSAGNRDAWTIAWNREYAVGVWFGNPDGRGASILVGAEAAAPTAAAIIRELPAPVAAPFPPPNCRSRKICSRSGLVAGPDCPGQDREYHIPGLSPSRRCPGPNGPGGPSVETCRIPPIRFSSPLDGSTLRLLPGQAGLIPLAAEIGKEASGKTTCYWFVDGALLGTTAGGSGPDWTAEAGEHTICCALPGGEGDSVRITVEIGR